MRIFVCLLALLAAASVRAAELSGVLTADVLKKSSFELPEGVYTTGDFNIPEHFTLKFAPGAVIEVKKNAVLRINGCIESSLQKIFAGEGKVSGKLRNTTVYPEWFGAKGDDKTDNTIALQKAAALAASSYTRHLTINPGRYRFSGDITMNCNISCSGVLVNIMELDPSKTFDRGRVYLIELTIYLM